MGIRFYNLNGFFVKKLAHGVIIINTLYRIGRGTTESIVKNGFRILRVGHFISAVGVRSAAGKQQKTE